MRSLSMHVSSNQLECAANSVELGVTHDGGRSTFRMFGCVITISTFETDNASAPDGGPRFQGLA